MGTGTGLVLVCFFGAILSNWISITMYIRQRAWRWALVHAGLGAPLVAITFYVIKDMKRMGLLGFGL